MSDAVSSHRPRWCTVSPRQRNTVVTLVANITATGITFPFPRVAFEADQEGKRSKRVYGIRETTFSKNFHTIRFDLEKTGRRFLKEGLKRKDKCEEEFSPCTLISYKLNFNFSRVFAIYRLGLYRLLYILRSV